MFITRSALPRLVLGAVAIAGIAWSAAEATTSTGTLAVSATVVSVCTVSNTGLAFGDYDPTAGAQTNGTGTITVNCTPGTAYTVSLGAGNGSGASVSSRRMTLGSSILRYSLYRDAARTLIWGQTAGIDTFAATAGSQPDTLTVYGLVPAAQAVPAGLYTDTVVVTVTY